MNPFPASAKRLATSFAAVAGLLGLAGAQQILQNHQFGAGIDDLAITPDERYGILRDITHANDQMHVIDLATGQLAATFPGSLMHPPWYAVQDAIACTNDRAVMIGEGCDIVDLSALSRLAKHPVGSAPQDVAITPDGSMVVVRGGLANAQGPAGIHVFDLATGAPLAFAPGNPTPWNFGNPSLYSFPVDSVVASDAHAIGLSAIGTAAARVSILELHPQGGGAPKLAFESGGACSSCGDLAGVPHDLALTTDGRYVAVRSEFEIALYDLTASPPISVWKTAPDGNPGPLLEKAMDSVEASGSTIATLSTITNPNLQGGAQIEVFDLAGNRAVDRVAGTPHDLGFSPDGSRLVVRTSAGVWLYDLSIFPSTPTLTSIGSASIPTSAAPGYLAGLDSVSVGATRAATLHSSGTQTTVHVRAYVWDISGSTLTPIGNAQVTNTHPVDIELSSDEQKVYVGGTIKCAVLQAATGKLALVHSGVAPHAYFPWSDSLAVGKTRALAGGYGPGGAPTGWTDVIRASELFTNYCAQPNNATGKSPKIEATGSGALAANDLTVVASNLPVGGRARLIAGTTQASVIFGASTLCVGSFVPFPTRKTIASDVAETIDLAHMPKGVVVAPGSTWHFQFQYANGSGVNAPKAASQALSVTFLP